MSDFRQQLLPVYVGIGIRRYLQRLSTKRSSDIYGKRKIYAIILYLYRYYCQLITIILMICNNTSFVFMVP